MTLLLCTALITPAQGAKIEKRAQAGMTFLLINPSARAAGLMASNGLEGAAALFQNPSGIARIDGGEFMVGQTQWFADITQSAVALAYRIEGFGVVGLSWVSMDHGDIFRTTINEDPTTVGFSELGQVDVDESVIGLAYAREVTDRFTIGAQVKRASQRLQDNRASAMAVDFGLTYRTGYRSSRLTMSVRNFSKEIQYIDQSVQLPLTFKVGLDVDAFELLAPQLSETGSLLVQLERSHHRDSPEKMDLGLEYTFQNMLSVRAGSGFNYDENDLGFGVGLNVSKLRVDYAYNSYGDVLGAVHRISLAGRF
jgi:hypothetical protein